MARRLNAVARIEIPRLHAAQAGIYEHSNRHNVVVCGRRYGKTRLGLFRAYHTMLDGKSVGWFAPTFKILLDAWRELKTRMGPIITDCSEQEKRIVIATGGSFEAWSMDRGNAGRSRDYDEVHVDEAAFVARLRYEFESSIRPTLSKSRGTAWFYSTPKGFDEFHDLFERGQDAERKTWSSWQQPTLLNPYIDPQEIDEARADMDARIFAQEYEASFEYFAGRVYVNFNRAENVREDIVDHGGPVWVGMDFNVSPMSAIFCQKAGDQLHAFDELTIMDSGTQEMCDAIKRRFPGRHITVYPDPSGHNRATAAPVGQTDLVILRREGFHVIAPNSHCPVVDRINCVNAMCLNGKGVRRLFVSPKCKHLIAGLEQLAYKEGTCAVDKKNNLDHMPDALGYLITMEFPIVSPARFAKVSYV